VSRLTYCDVIATYLFVHGGEESGARREWRGGCRRRRVEEVDERHGVCKEEGGVSVTGRGGVEEYGVSGEGWGVDVEEVGR